MGRIERQRKYAKGGGSSKRKRATRPRYSPPEPPMSRLRRKASHHKSIANVTLNLSGEELWRTRRIAIYVHWRDTFHCPPPESWPGKDGTIYAIIQTLNMSRGSYKTVKKTLKQIWQCHSDGVEYTGDSLQVGCAPHNPPMIKRGSIEEQIVADAVEDNVGYTATMFLVNSHIKAVDVGSPHVGRSAVKTAVDRLKPKVAPIMSASQQTNLTAEDPLGKARYEQIQQYRLRLGRVRFEDLSPEDQQRPAFQDMDRHKFVLHQVGWWDEMHPSCRIGGRAPGPQAKIQRQFLRDINTGKLIVDYDTKGINGNYATPQRWGKVKYKKEIRLALGCCMIKLTNGESSEMRGVRLPPFDYTNKWIVTITEYEEECIPRQIRKIRQGSVKRGWVVGERSVDDGIFDDDPVTRLKGLGKSTAKHLARMGVKRVKQFARMRQGRINKVTRLRGVTGTKVEAWLQEARSAHPGKYVCDVTDYRKAANPYLARYGDDWEAKIRQDIRTAGKVCITELILHMRDATAAAYAGTEFARTYLIYHDALTQLTYKKTRAWMEKEGIMKHWLLPVGECNAGTVYYGRPVGNSPELMPWDCSLNQDVHTCVEFYSSVCRWYGKDHPLYPSRFSKASYSIMRDSYLRVLDPETGVCPSSDRIVQDITRCWGEHLDLICAYKGGAVPGIGNRVGKRRLSGKKVNRGGKRKKGAWKMLEHLHPDMVEHWKAYLGRSRQRHSAGMYTPWI